MASSSKIIKVCGLKKPGVKFNPCTIAWHIIGPSQNEWSMGVFDEAGRDYVAPGPLTKEIVGKGFFGERDEGGWTEAMTLESLKGLFGNEAHLLELVAASYFGPEPATVLA